MRRGVNVFLTELIVMTAVLAASLSICLGVFVNASRMRQEARDLSQATAIVQSAAECYFTTGDINATSVLMGGDGGNVPFGELTLHMVTQMSGKVSIYVEKGGKEIYGVYEAVHSNITGVNK